MTNGSGDMTAAFATALESASAEPAAETSPVSTPTPETPTAETSAPAATTQAAEATPEPAPASTEEKPAGEPPQWRWQDILETQRKKAAEEARHEVEQQYAELRDFRSMAAEERAGLLVWNRALRGDPDALAQVAQVNPSLAAAISGKSAPTQTQPEQEPQPDAAIQLADGSTVPVFTSEGMKKREAWLQAQLEAQLSKRFEPLAQTAEQLRAHQEAVARQQQTQQWAVSVLTPMKGWPYFDEFKPGIQKALAELPTGFDGRLEDVVASAYSSQLQAKLDALTKQGESKALASLQQRAVAGTTHPSAATASTPPTFSRGPEGFAEALRHFSGSEAR
jgi:hypothetical protein